MISQLVYLTGVSVILFSFVRLGLWLFRSFFYKSTTIHGSVKGKWAVVTGSTSGIGLGFARELARRGSNVVLVARSEEKLSNVSKELEQSFRVKTRRVVIDFASKEDYSERFAQAIEDLEVGVLVNNVGINTEIPDEYLNMSQKDVDDMIQVNINSLLNVTRVVMPRMLKGSPSRPQGLVVNLSSFTSDFPTPLMAVYSATKAFIDAFSRCLRSEYPQLLDVLSLTPMWVASNMTHIKRASFTACTGEDLAKRTFNGVGAPLLPSSWSPYWPHTLIKYVMSLMPERFADSKTRAQMKALKAKLLKRKNRQ